MFLGMDIYSWIAAIVIALIVTFLPITLPFKIVLAMVAMACFYFWTQVFITTIRTAGPRRPA